MHNVKIMHTGRSLNEQIRKKMFEFCCKIVDWLLSAATYCI